MGSGKTSRAEIFGNMLADVAMEAAHITYNAPRGIAVVKACIKRLQERIGEIQAKPATTEYKKARYGRRQKMKVTIYDRVKVRLSSAGRDTFEDYRKSQRLGKEFESDSDGYHYFELRELIMIFGSHDIDAGGDSPFEDYLMEFMEVEKV